MKTPKKKPSIHDNSTRARRDEPNPLTTHRHRIAATSTITILLLTLTAALGWQQWTHLREPQTPQTLCGALSTAQITAIMGEEPEGNRPYTTRYGSRAALVCNIDFPEQGPSLGRWGSISILYDQQDTFTSFTGSTFTEDEFATEAINAKVFKLDTPGLVGSTYAAADAGGALSYGAWFRPDGPTLSITIIEDGSQYCEQDILDVMPSLLTYIGTTLDQQLTTSPTPDASTQPPRED